MHSAGAVTCVQPAAGAAAVVAGVVAAVSGTVVAGSAVVVEAAVSTADEAGAAAVGVGGAAVLDVLDESSEHAAKTTSKTTASAATRFTCR